MFNLTVKLMRLHYLIQEYNYALYIRGMTVK